MIFGDKSLLFIVLSSGTFSKVFFSQSGLLAADMTKNQAMGPNQHMCVAASSWEKNRHRWSEDGFLFDAKKFIFQACMDFASSQRHLGTATFLNLCLHFLFYFILLIPINHLLRIVIITYLKPYSCVQIIHITQEYLINRITNVK